MVQILFPDGDGIFQNDNAHAVKNWYQEHESELVNMECPPQSPDLLIIEHFWCVLERQVRNRYPPPSCLKEQARVFGEEWLKIPLDEVRKLHSCIPRRIAAVQKEANSSCTEGSE